MLTVLYRKLQMYATIIRKLYKIQAIERTDRYNSIIEIFKGELLKGVIDYKVNGGKRSTESLERIATDE